MSQLRTMRPTLALLYLPVAGLLGGATLMSLVTDTTLAEFTRDPAATTGAHPLLGVVSNIGVLCWCATAVACFLSAAVLHRQASRSRLRPFLFSAGLLTSVLLFDDLFMLHDWFVVYELQMDEKLLFAVYGLMLATFLVRFRDVILSSQYVLLELALGFFAISLAMDALAPETLRMQHLYEDGAKLLGIVSWLGYFVGAALEALTPGDVSASDHRDGAASCSDAKPEDGPHLLEWDPVVPAHPAAHAGSPGSSRPGA